MTEAFRKGGLGEARRALREQYAARIAELEQELEATRDDGEQARLQSAIEATKKELAQKERILRRSLFGTA